MAKAAGQAQSEYTLTVGDLSRQSGVGVASLCKYARWKMLDFILASSGQRLYRADQAKVAHAIREQRLANRGKRQPA